MLTAYLEETMLRDMLISISLFIGSLDNIQKPIVSQPAFTWNSSSTVDNLASSDQIGSTNSAVETTLQEENDWNNTLESFNLELNKISEILDVFLQKDVEITAETTDKIGDFIKRAKASLLEDQTKQVAYLEVLINEIQALNILLMDETFDAESWSQVHQIIYPKKTQSIPMKFWTETPPEEETLDIDGLMLIAEATAILDAEE